MATRGSAPVTHRVTAMRLSRGSRLVTWAVFLLPCSLSAQQAEVTDTAVASAEAAAHSWLTLVDQVRYGQSWDSAAAIFRNAVSKPAWERAVLAVRGPLEPFGARKLRSATFSRVLPNAPPGEYVVLSYEAALGGGRTAVETVTPMRESDGRWRVSGYYVLTR